MSVDNVSTCSKCKRLLFDSGAEVDSRLFIGAPCVRIVRRRGDCIVVEYCYDAIGPDHYGWELEKGIVQREAVIGC